MRLFKLNNKFYLRDINYNSKIRGVPLWVSCFSCVYLKAHICSTTCTIRKSKL